jgi:adenosylhomocysteine nucleosidase
MLMNTKIIMLQGAMDLETELLIASLEQPQEYLLGKWRFVEGIYKDKPLVIAATSIGSANAAAATALGIEHFHPAAVINQGTAGGHAPALKAFDIVLGKQSFDASSYRTAKEEQADWRHMELMGAYAYDPQEKTFLPQSVYYSGDQKLLEAAHKAASDYTHGKVVDGCFASSNTWNRQKERIRYLHEQFGSSCEEMEVHSAAQICQQYKIPFLGIRIISNTEFQDEEFQPESAKACQQFVLKVVQNITL